MNIEVWRDKKNWTITFVWWLIIYFYLLSKRWWLRNSLPLSRLTFSLQKGNHEMEKLVVVIVNGLTRYFEWLTIVFGKQTSFKVTALSKPLISSLLKQLSFRAAITFNSFSRRSKNLTKNIFPLKNFTANDGSRWFLTVAVY